MPRPTSPKPAHFSVFRSASEEAGMKIAEQNWDDEGGHIASVSARIVRAPGAEMPYLVILSQRGSADASRAFATMREAEAYARCNIPFPARLSTLFDRAPDEGLGSTSAREVIS